MDDFFSFDCSTKVFVYDDYEIITFNNIEEISFQSMKRFYERKTSGGIDYVPFQIFLNDYKNSFDYLDIKDKPISIILPTEEAIQKALDRNEMKVYNPLDKRNAHIHFANINDDKRLLDFCRNYGIPFGFSPINSKGPASLAKLSDIHIQVQITHSIYKQSNYLSKTIELWKSIQNKNNKMIDWAEYEQLFNVNTNKERKLLNWLDKAAILLNVQLKHVDCYSTFERDKGKIKPSIEFRDIHALSKYLLKKSIVLGKTIYKECEFCGRSFEAIHASSRFCPAPPHSKMNRSTCQNAYSQSETRKRKKQSKEEVFQNG